MSDQNVPDFNPSMTVGGSEFARIGAQGGFDKRQV